MTDQRLTPQEERQRLAEHWRFAGEPSEKLTDRQVIQALIGCASAWEPQVRLLGNLRAGRIARVLQAVLDRDEEERPFHEWAQEYLSSGRWAGHNRCDAVRAELIERDGQLAQTRAEVDRLRGERQGMFDVLAAARDVLAAFAKQAGVIPAQNAYSTTMTDGERQLWQAVTDIDAVLTAAAPDATVPPRPLEDTSKQLIAEARTRVDPARVEALAEQLAPEVADDLAKDGGEQS